MHELDTMESWKKGIDTLLVFVSPSIHYQSPCHRQNSLTKVHHYQAGLFSTILTAFIVEYYTQLLPPSVPVILNLNVESRNISFDPLSSSSASPSAAAVTINILWFLALVLSLAAASIGLSAKQWLEDYPVPQWIHAMQQLRIWNLRRQMLEAWFVPQIIESLPLLLQTALLSFLSGISVLLWTLNSLIAGIVLVPIAALFLFTVFTAVVPTLVRPGCPYKSPQARWVYLLIQTFTKRYDGTISRDQSESNAQYAARRKRAALSVGSWSGREDHWMHSQVDVQTPAARGPGDTPSAETVKIFVAVDSILQDKDLLELFLPALRRQEIRVAYDAISSIICARTHLTSLDQLDDPRNVGLFPWFKDEVNKDIIHIVTPFVLDILLSRSLRSHSAPPPNSGWENNQLCNLLNLLRSLLQGCSDVQPHCLKLLGWLSTEISDTETDSETTSGYIRPSNSKGMPDQNILDKIMWLLSTQKGIIFSLVRDDNLNNNGTCHSPFNEILLTMTKEDLQTVSLEKRRKYIDTVQKLSHHWLNRHAQRDQSHGYDAHRPLADRARHLLKRWFPLQSSLFDTEMLPLHLDLSMQNAELDLFALEADDWRRSTSSRSQCHEHRLSALDDSMN